jgi:hypothetical protein
MCSMLRPIRARRAALITGSPTLKGFRRFTTWVGTPKGRRLGITERTVKAHRRTIMDKMETKSLAELVTMIVTVRLNETSMMT